MSGKLGAGTLPALHVISLPDVLGVQWESDTGSQYQLFVFRSQMHKPKLGWRVKGRREWTITRIDAPERFGTITNRASLLAYARSFLSKEA